MLNLLLQNYRLEISALKMIKLNLPIRAPPLGGTGDKLWQQLKQLI
jgi:hypothetical protein